MTDGLTDLYTALSHPSAEFSPDTDSSGADDFTRTLTFTVESVDQDRSALLLDRACL